MGNKDLSDTGNVRSLLPYKSGIDHIFYEFHPFKTIGLPFILQSYTVTNHSVVPPEEGSCPDYYYDNVLNWHENIEFFYITNGEGNIRCGINTIHVHKGDIVAVNPYIVHGIIYDSDFEYYYLIVDKDFCITNNIDISTLRLTEHIHNPELAAKFDDIISASQSMSILAEASFKCTVLSFLVNIYENHGCFGKTLNIDNKLLENIGIALEYIEVNLSKKLTLETIAFEVGFSKYHFAREFKRLTGQTVIDYINLKRCEAAKHLLAKENISIKEVAESCGFDSLSYFGKIFKKYTGFSPSEFKRFVE